MAGEVTPWVGDGPTTGDLLFPGSASVETEAAERLKGFVLSPDGLPSQIDVALIRDAFEGTFFRGVGNFVDPGAAQTGMRDLALDPQHRVFEFDVWSDPEGKKRTRRLRIEIGEQDGRSPIDRHDFELVGEIYIAATREQDRSVDD
ncbi:hypothetical protein HYS42_01625 [Candidatus Saccharibacteria bacterium]|nr:hypothetical protein [Candidatus Saccharibacteria bacterium]